MSTNSRIGYLENGMVKSIYCHWDGYPSWNGVVLHECYRDLDKVKELVDRMGYISALGRSILCTRFAGGPQQDMTNLESVEKFKEFDYEYHYLFDGDRWTVIHSGQEAKMVDILANPQTYERFEPGMMDGYGRMLEIQEKLRNGLQTWKEPKERNWKYLESYFVPDNGAVVIFNGFNNEKLFEIPCSAAEATVISDRIYGRSLEDISQEFCRSVDQIVSEAVLVSGQGRYESIDKSDRKEEFLM